MATEKFSNNASTTLTQAVLVSDTVIHVNSIGTFPSTPQYRIVIDSELMVVTAVAGSPGNYLLTVTRGAENTTAASHTNSTVVNHIYTAGAMNQAISDNFQIGTVGNFNTNFPLPEKQGRLFVPTDGFFAYHDNASTWTAFGPIFPINPPPLGNYFTGINLNLPIYQENNGTLFVGVDGAGHFNRWVTTLPSTPYTVTMALTPLVPTWAGDYPAGGLLLRDGLSPGNGHNIHFEYQYRSDSGIWHFRYGRYCNDVGSACYQGEPFVYRAPMMGTLIWIRIKDTGTTRSFLYSTNGQHWLEMYSEATNTYITPTQAGFAVGTHSSVFRSSMTIFHWDLQPTALADY
jgi:hypothetical protein